MNVLDLIAERRGKLAYEKDRAQALEIFTKQKEAVKAISETQGFKEIRSYWIREMEAAQGMLMSCKDMGSLAHAQANMSTASRFIDFLDNLAR